VKRAALALATFLVVAGAVFLVLRARDADPRKTGVAGLQAVGDDPFADGDVVRAAADTAILDPSGSRLAVIGDDGLGVAERGKVRPVTAPGSHVVDAAWFANGATLLVAEGPAPTGELAVVDVDGTVRGAIPLRPSVGFGTGHGMAVAVGGKRAVVTAVERPALEAERRFLVLVDLERGRTVALTTAGGPDESGPHVVDADRVAFTETTAGGGHRAMVVDLTTGEATEVEADAEVVGATEEAVVVVRGGELLALPVTAPGGAPQRLGAVPDGTVITGVDGLGGRAVAVDRQGRVRRITIDPVEGRSGAGR
jgi:hypothetical protein